MLNKVFPVPKLWKDRAYLDSASYAEKYQQSLSNPDQFWSEEAQRIDWIKSWSKVKSTTFEKPVRIEWFTDAKLNVCFNCVDRHALASPEKVALIWEPESERDEVLKLTYGELLKRVCRLANGLKSLGVKKGDRVTIYLPMIPEAAISMLACARIGAIHSVVFGGFSPESLAGRIDGCESDFLITADEGLRGGKTVPLKTNADLAAQKAPHVKKMIVVKRIGAKVNWVAGRDVWYHELVAAQPETCEPEVMDAEDPLFMLYTSGSTSKPKGVLHTSGGYIVFATSTFHYIFDYRPGEIYWCAADVGWVTGHTYMIYGPLANGATTVLYEGLPTFPTPARIWQIVDKHQVNILYTAPTLIRSLIASGDDFVRQTSRKSLRLLGSVGEPINPEAWLWYYQVAGNSDCPIVDTYWQTETGGIIISPLPGATDLKPGAALKPFFGIQPVLLDEKGQMIEGEGSGVLCIADSWPGQMRTVYKDHDRFYSTYFAQYPGYYFTGDGARRDTDGDLWILGRVDDVINMSGHRVGTAEVESALVEHAEVAEAAVVGFPHEIKGQGLYCFVTLKTGHAGSDSLRKELIDLVRKEIGSFAKPDHIQFAPALPKTRSGKIMRRILRKIAEGDLSTLGDTSTLADPQVVNDLVTSRPPL